jgi:hypothetical protein
MNIRPVCLLLLAAALLLSSAFPLAAQRKGDIEVKASIGADKIGLEDVLIYTVTVRGISNPKRPDLSGIEDFNVERTSLNAGWTNINGVFSFYTSFIYYLTPKKSGTFTLPPVEYSYQGRDYKTQAFTVQVVTGSVAPHQQPQQQARRRLPSIFDDDDFFSSPFKRTQPQEVIVRMVPVISKKKVVKGEQFVLKVLLYTRNTIRSVEMVSKKSIPGFWQEWFEVPNPIYGETKTIDGKIYRVFEVRKVALFPTKTGTIIIPPLKFDINLPVDSFSIFPETRVVSRSTPALNVEVADLPQAASGLPVGRFKLEVRSAKKEVDVNDVLTLKIRISGMGNLKTITPPELKSSEYYKVYPAKISRDVSLKDNGVSGYVEAEMPVSFKKNGLISLPPLQFKYYDPARAEIASLRSEPVMINVSGSKEEQVSSASTVPRTDIIKTGEDIDFIKNGSIHNQVENLYRGTLFLLLLLLPFVANALFIFKKYAFDRYIVNSALLTGKKRLNRAVKALHGVREPGRVSPILENYLKEKAGVGLSALTNQGIDQLLAKHGVSDSDIKTFIRIKNQSDSSRFSPQKNASSAKEFKHDIRVLIEILRRIDNKIK